MSDALQALDSWRNWLVVGLVIWLVGGPAVALVLGRVIRERDEQVPVDTDPIPTQER